MDDDETAWNLPSPVDLVIMNPPFTRDSLRHDQFSPADEQAIKRREKEVLEGQPHRAAGRLHSSGGAFTVLAEKMLKHDTGMQALVLPSSGSHCAGQYGVTQVSCPAFPH